MARAARARTTISYRDLCEEINPEGFNFLPRDSALSDLLCTISRRTYATQQVLLAAVVGLA